MSNKSLMIGIITILLLISTSAGCLQKDTDISKTIKEDRESEKPVPVEYYVEEDRSVIYPYYSNFYYNPLWLSKFNITEEEGNEITAQCRIAFEQNAERLAREVPTKIPENWIKDEVLFKKERFLMENDTASLKKSDNKVIVRFRRIIEYNVNHSAFNYSVLAIYLENNCIYNLKEKKVEKIRITFHPELPYE